MTTTHYSDLEILERNTKGRFENYKFEVDYDNEHNIHFHYKLMRGVSRQYIALDLLKKSGFDEDLIETALDMSKKIKILNKSFNKKKMIKKNKNIENVKNE